MKYSTILSQSNYMIVNKKLAKNLGLINSIVVSNLCSLEDKYGNGFFFNQEELSETCCVCLDTIKKSLSFLKKEGYLEIEKKGLPCKNYYSFTKEFEKYIENLLVKEETNKLDDNNSNKLDDFSTNKEMDNNTNNINNTINNTNNKEDKDKSLSKKDDLFEECWKTYKRKGSKSISQRYWKKLSETEKANVQKHIPYYIKSVDNIKYIKDFERYLRDKIFESVVYKNGSIIYDPERIIDDGIYHPMTDMFGVFWSDNTKCYISSNMLGTQMFQDGYTNENRPNNSIIMYQGTRFHWNSEIKRWEENK